MKLTVKTLQGVAFPIEAELTDTVLSVKAKIEQQNGSAVDLQKLIHAGKVLKDESPLSEYNVKENDFLVVMVTKPKAAKKPAAAPAAAPAATPAAAPVAAPVAASVATPAAPAPAAPTATPAAAQAEAPAAPAGIVVGEALSATIQQLCDMGFPEDQVRLALQAAFNNPDRAVEYLMNGIPDTRQIPVGGAPAAAAPAAPSAAGGLAGTNSLEALRNHPQFDALRRLIQSNPAALPTVLQQIGGQSPELLRLIHANQEQFVRMLNEPIAEAAPADQGGFGDMDDMGGAMPTPQQLQQLMASLSPEQQAQMAAQMGMTPQQLQQFSQMLSQMPPEAVQQMMQQMGGGAPGAGAPTRIHLTEEEAAAINRLVDMGFDRNEAVQAYLACDKNEALAANFLMDSMSGDYDDAAGGNFGGDSNDDIYG
ncbi:UV excision repair protein Rad23 [Saprolegnia parasitica CBS 223.65]|uniref:UV excision repair protein Rad23 n=1 Tax=Saprolegnia parasitica (strain CBS 223.65) TaxID=695850 RepID=A0A067D6B3_SAPPC|nr:UV excision repair protein Rad23 [Saprolegnia parasitica CBS 223.65]KDO34552.1 UV excision repair protein Rad23 [Saprolegnia parasitica CBS 223.65]|eukprot:XP_012194230.1 UV excision repair protein Rad23 [Saprolegnia parasitica CBS 223.65]